MDQKPDYTSWSNADLIKRVTDLEVALRRQNARHTTSLDTSLSEPKKKPKKPSKGFDPSKYNTRLIALKFAYLGGNYNGFEHHANNVTPLPTIEEELWKALKKTRLIFPVHKPGQSEEEVSWEGCDYSKCGRTDRGVSAFGQVIGIRVRSARPKTRTVVEDAAADSPMPDVDESAEPPREFDYVRDELPYIQLINRVLPPDIRVLAWCPHTTEDFSARFDCKERRYRYFFTNPAFIPLPGSKGVAEDGSPDEGWLNIAAMEEAAKKYEGLHDFRNFCKVDPSKQISKFERRIFHSGIHEVNSSAESGSSASLSPKLYYFEVRGSAFLWHQVRHLVAILFLVAQGYEKPSIVGDLLDIQKTPAKPAYEMASDAPLVLWDCIFPDLAKLDAGDLANSDAKSEFGYEDGMDWVYVGDEAGGRDQAKRTKTAIEDGKHGRNGMMEELWALWRKRKMDEVLAWSLMDVVANQGQNPCIDLGHDASGVDRSARMFDGGEKPRAIGEYVVLAQRECMETPDVVNARYAVRKGLNGTRRASVDEGVDE
ncbi:tRNA pseudouridine(38/39) synthase [Fulvia fulva]|uniref:tRNA pseudouridine(38/39) synthase n=1 Tax=Passalora fulva TaxID=5499 RepID=A0A9Q8LEJ9_PASFU|nr:tRNA pseudouridine(38/39) synthase [Fulvia fulva]KAK4627321.1 tRNA pseudouridine(38/39) synthase [Fulvia fulva]KAK4627687.1 tRNA pseudouridine(38/39) synthase [Fulvia fulva]UJO15971.1 tRNA pseudouridine(38/39) synthase [Fulvia fulva]WPV13595.1 tRNA pseudouridine(38/39) synthase [Fulvia fulva]WPV28315.1 tRNA pseudouridine(38/39) synthase [Fulvia fulva]